VGGGSGEAGVHAYKALPMLGAELMYDEAAGATYTYDRAIRVFVSFDTPGMVARKVRC
jgi:chitinase